MNESGVTKTLWTQIRKIQNEKNKFLPLVVKLLNGIYIFKRMRLMFLHWVYGAFACVKSQTNYSPFCLL